MRDDIRTITDETARALDRKNTLLTRFLAKEHELNSFIKSDFDNEPLLIIEEENDLIGLVNIQDYIISGLNDEFRSKTGKNLSGAELLNFADEDGSLDAVEKLRAEGKRLITEISDLRRINNAIMNRLKIEILKDAGELKRMMELEIDPPKDCQSSY